MLANLLPIGSIGQLFHGNKQDCEDSKMSTATTDSTRPRTGNITWLMPSESTLASLAERVPVKLAPLLRLPVPPRLHSRPPRWDLAPFLPYLHRNFHLHLHPISPLLDRRSVPCVRQNRRPTPHNFLPKARQCFLQPLHRFPLPSFRLLVRCRPPFCTRRNERTA